MTDSKKAAEDKGPFERKAKPGKSNAHVHHKNVVCITDSRGFPTHHNLDLTQIRLNASNGFIPLWDRGVTLRWRFNDWSINRAFENPDAAKDGIRRLLGDALNKWGDASPVLFDETQEVPDFEIFMMADDDCEGGGCVLASAFFPDAGRHELVLYPKLFNQSRKEQVDTIIHELGHVFGLRHFFANTRESAWPSRLFGEDTRFSIMNYGDDSELTETDRNDLKRLYAAVWSGELTSIDGAPVRLFQPFSALRGPAVSALSAVAKPVAYTPTAAVPTGAGPLAQIIVNGRRITIE